MECYRSSGKQPLDVTQSVAWRCSFYTVAATVDDPDATMTRYRDLTAHMLLAVAGDRGHLVAFSCRSSDADTDELPGNARPQTVARLCCPKVHLCNRLLEFDIDNVKFVSWPVTVDNNDHMTTFNVVAALPKGAYSVRAQHIARATVTQLAAALIHEERRKSDPTLRHDNV